MRGSRFTMIYYDLTARNFRFTLRGSRFATMRGSRFTMIYYGVALEAVQDGLPHDLGERREPMLPRLRGYYDLI